MTVTDALGKVNSAYSALSKFYGCTTEICEALELQGIKLSGFPRSAWPDIINDYKSLGVRGMKDISEYSQYDKPYTNANGNVIPRFNLAACLKDKDVKLNGLNLSGNVNIGDITEGLLRYSGTSDKIKYLNVNGGDKCTGSIYGETGFSNANHEPNVLPLESIKVTSTLADVCIDDTSSCKKVEVASTGTGLADFSLIDNTGLEKAKFSTNNSGSVRRSCVTVDNCKNLKKLEAYGNVTFIQRDDTSSITDLHLTADKADPNCTILVAPGAKVTYHDNGQWDQTENISLGVALDMPVVPVVLNTAPQIHTATSDTFGMAYDYRGCIQADVSVSIDETWVSRKQIASSGASVNIGSLMRACGFRGGENNYVQVSESITYKPSYSVDLSSYDRGEYCFSANSASRIIRLSPTQDYLQKLFDSGPAYNVLMSSKILVKMSAGVCVHFINGQPSILGKGQVAFEAYVSSRRGHIKKFKDGYFGFL